MSVVLIIHIFNLDNGYVGTYLLYTYTNIILIYNRQIPLTHWLLNLKKYKNNELEIRNSWSPSYWSDV